VEFTAFMQKFMLENIVGSTELFVLAMKAVKVGWLEAIAQ